MRFEEDYENEDEDDDIYDRSVFIPPSGTVVARTRDVEVADELLYFANRHGLRLEYTEDPERVLVVGVDPADVAAIQAYMAAGPFVTGDFEPLRSNLSRSA